MRVGEGEVRVERDRLTVKLDSAFVILEQRVRALFVGQGAQIKHVGVRVLGRLLFDPDFFFRRQGGAERLGDLGRQLAIDPHRIGNLAIVAFRPDMAVGVGVDQLDIDRNPVREAAHASLEDGRHA